MSDEDNVPDRKALEADWRKRVADAKLRLEHARNFVKEVQQDLRSQQIPSSDGYFALRRALRVEELALKSFARILTKYNNLLLYGKIPKEES